MEWAIASHVMERFISQYGMQIASCLIHIVPYFPKDIRYSPYARCEITVGGSWYMGGNYLVYSLGSDP